MELLYKTFIKNYKNTKDRKVITSYGLLASSVGLLLNIFLFVAKLFIAIISSSVSIISDAFNNLSDASSSLITLIGFKISSKPADKEHPYGHQRMEYICAFVVSIIILIIGGELGFSSIKKVIDPSKIEFNYIMIIILTLSILIKLWMGLFYKYTSKKINSLSLKAASQDSFNDVITTLFILIGLIIGNLINFNIDGYLGVAVSLYIMFQGFSLIKETMNSLIGGTPDEELINKVKDEVFKEPQVLGIHDILFHYYGWNEIYMSLHAEMDSSLSLIQAHDLIDSIEKKINKLYKIDLVIHIDPVLLNDELRNKIYEELKRIVSEYNSELDFHELKINNKNNKKIIAFDLSVPYDFNLSNEEIYNHINKELKKINNSYRASINFDKK